MYVNMKRIVAVILLLLPFTLFAQQKSVDSLRMKTLMLKRFMEKNHYKPLVWNDTSSAMLHKKWLEELDDEKLFFTQKEITLLDTYKTKLDDEINGNGWNFFTTSINLLSTRIKKADSIVAAFLSQQVDFSKPDKVEWPAKTYAANEQEFVKNWQRYLKWQLLSNISNKYIAKNIMPSATIPADFSKTEAEERIKIKRKEGIYFTSLLQTPKLFLAEKQDEYLNAVAWCYDPHSNYFNLKERDEFNAEGSAMEYSAGLSFSENEKGDKAIDFLQPGGSAWKSGQLHKGDILIKVKVNGKENDIEDVSEEEVTELLQNAGNTDIELTVRTVADEIKTVTLAQEKISSEEGIVKSYVIKGKNNIGYINLPGFYSREEEDAKEENYNGCANDVSKEIIKLRKDKIGGLIIDLRNNGGGSMWEAMQLAGIFVDAGPVASFKEKDGKVQFLKDPNRGTIYDGPLIVLINGASASASEFLSATLQDYNRALIVGGTTYGKGTAQGVFPLDTLKEDPNKKYEDFVKVTGGKFYRINGSTVQWKGVEPDIAFPDIYADISFKEKANESALVPDRSKVGNFKPLPALPINDLKTKSDVRTASNDYFKSMNAFSLWISTYKNGNIIPLQWNTYNAYKQKVKANFDLLGDVKKDIVKLISADNNSFDKERFSLSGKENKQTNETYLKNINSDNEIAEACKIFDDWIIK